MKPTETIQQQELSPVPSRREYIHASDFSQPDVGRDPGYFMEIPFENTQEYTAIIKLVPSHVSVLSDKLLADPDLKRIGERYLKCQSKEYYLLMCRTSKLEELGYANTKEGRYEFYDYYIGLTKEEKEELGDGVEYTKLTCDNKFCDDPCCVAHRNKKVIDTYQPLLTFLWNPNPHARMNLRGLELTSDLLPTPENLTMFQKKLRSFMKKKSMKRFIFSYIAAYHIHQSRLHAHIIVWGLWLPAQHLSAAWHTHTGWHNTNIKQLKGGLRSHLGHLTKYLAKPFILKDDPDNAINIIKGFYKRRLITAAGIKNAMKRHYTDTHNKYVRIGPEFIRSSLISIIRNNCNPQTSKTEEEYIFDTAEEEELLYTELGCG